MLNKSLPVASIIAIVLIAAAVILGALVSVFPLHNPPSVSEDGGASAFSLDRAMEDLSVITQQPRVPGTPGYAVARNHIAAELEALGLEVEVTDTISVRSQAGNANAARARSVVARLRGTDSTGAVLLGGHLDTVHTTEGASDCGTGAVSVLETARALTEAPAPRNDVIFIIEDGEETSRSGSNSFATQHRWAEDVQVAINLEAMGTGGSSLLYVTGEENQWLIDEALQVMPNPVAYSFANDLVWKTGTGGSDLDQFLTVAEAGLGLVYLNNVPAYHTMADNIENLDPATFYHHGSTMLSLAEHYADLNLEQNISQGTAVYFNLFSRFVIHYPAWAGVIIAAIAAATLSVILGFGFRDRRLEWKGIFVGAAVFLPLAIVAAAVSGLLWYALRATDPRLQVFLIGVTYDRPIYSVAFVLLSAALVTAGFFLLRKRKIVELSLGAAIWFALLSVLTSFILPGSSYIFSFALLFSLPAIMAMLHRDRMGAVLRIGLCSASAFLVALVYWPFVELLGIFSGRAELLMGLPVIAMFPALGVSLIVPLLLPVFQVVDLKWRWIVPAFLAGSALFVLTAISITAEFTPDRPKPNMAAYIMDGDAEETYWVTGSVDVGGSRASLMDEWTEQFFAEGYEEGLYSPWGGFMPDIVPAYTAPAPAVELELPEAILQEDSTDQQGHRHMRILLRSPDNAETMLAMIETEGRITGADIAGQEIQGPTPGSPWTALNLGVYGSTAGDGIELNIHLETPASLKLFLEDHRYSLPEIEGFDVNPRPDWMMPAPTFVSDATVARHTIVIE